MVTNSFLNKALQERLNPFERISDMFSGKDDRQDLTNLLLYELLSYFVGTPGVGTDGQPLPGSPLFGQFLIPLRIQTVDLLKNIQALTADAIASTVMADCRKALRIVVIVQNTLDQTVSMQVVGNTAPVAQDSTLDIGAPVNVATGERKAFGLAIDEWMPYVGVTCTPAGVPTGGALNAQCVIQLQGQEGI